MQTNFILKKDIILNGFYGKRFYYENFNAAVLVTI